MKIVIADDLPPSAVELLRSEAGWVVDARAGLLTTAVVDDSLNLPAGLNFADDLDQ